MARTTELIDKRTGDKIRVPNDMVVQALRSKQFQVSPENVHGGTIGVTRNRETTYLPTSDKKAILDRLNSGFALEPIRETHKRRLKEEYEGSTLTAMALANNALAMPTMGLSTQVMRRMPYFGASPDALAAIDEMSPMAAALGGVGGGVVDLASGKGLVSLAVKGSKKLATRVGARATVMGAGPTLARSARLGVEGMGEGLAFAEAQLIHENALGNAELTAQTVLATGAGGLAAGGVGGFLVGAATPAVSSIWGAGKGIAGRVAGKASEAVRMGGPSPAMGPQENIVENVFKWVQGKYSWEALEGLKKHAKRMAEQDKAFPWKSEKAIRDWMAEKNMVQLGDSLGSIKEKADTIVNQMGREVGEFYTKLDDITSQARPFGPSQRHMQLPDPITGRFSTPLADDGVFPIQKVLDELREEMARFSKVSGVKDYEGALKALEEELIEKFGQRLDAVADPTNLGGVSTPVGWGASMRMNRTSFKNAHTSMVELAKKADYTSTAKETAGKRANAHLRGIYNKHLEATADALTKRTDADLYKRWKFLKNEYGKAKTIQEIAEDTLSGQGARVTFGVRTTALASGAGATGGPVTAGLVAVGSEMAIRFGKTTIASTAGALKRMKLVKDGTMSTIARTIRNFAQGAPTKILGAVEDATGLSGRKLALPAGVKILQSISFDPQSPVTELSESNVRSATRLTKQLASLVSQPELVAERVTANLAHVEEIAPNTAMAMVNTEIRKLKHLHEVSPKYSYNGSTLQPMAFSEDYITEGDAEKFSRHLHAAMQPIPALFNDLADGTLMPETIETIAAVYPQMMEWIRTQFRDAYVERQTPIPFATNAMMATLLGEATTRDMTSGFQARHSAIWGGAKGDSMPTMKGIKKSRAAEGARQKNLRPSTDRVQTSLIS